MTHIRSIVVAILVAAAIAVGGIGLTAANNTSPKKPTSIEDCPKISDPANEGGYVFINGRCQHIWIDD